MRLALAALMSVGLMGAALADDVTCSATAKDKKLAGAALKSFMTKCERMRRRSAMRMPRRRTFTAPRKPASPRNA